MVRKLEPLDRLTSVLFFLGGSVAVFFALHRHTGTLHIYLFNSTRVIKKPPKWGQGSEVVSVGISRPYLRWRF